MFSALRRGIKKDEMKKKLCEGYPITRTPYTPPIMELATDSKTFTSMNATLQLTFAAEGSDLVKSKSLEMIRHKLLAFYKPVKGLRKEVESPFPNNVIAVSFSTHNFQVGEKCNEFKPFPSCKTLSDGFFTYQQLSENLQATYYNEDDVQYLAGFCYFPVAHGMPKLLRLDSKSFSVTVLGLDYFPPADRRTLKSYSKQKGYGRYCKRAGKRVTVDFSTGVIRHMEVDFPRNLYKYTECKECAEDHKAYKWEEPKKVFKAAPQKIDAPEEVSKSISFPVLDILQTAGIRCNELKTMDEDTLVSFIHKTKGTQLADWNCPKAKDLVQFVLLNPDWKLRTAGNPEPTDNSVRVVNRVTDEYRACDVYELPAWLDAHPDYDVTYPCHLIANFTLGMEYKNRFHLFESLDNAPTTVEVPSEQELGDVDPVELAASEELEDEAPLDNSVADGEESVEESETSSDDDSDMEHVVEDYTSDEGSVSDEENLDFEMVL